MITALGDVLRLPEILIHIKGQLQDLLKATAAGGCNLNEQLVMGQVNLIWAPVAFADFGIEYTYGRRKVVSGQHGDENVVTSRMRLRF